LFQQPPLGRRRTNALDRYPENALGDLGNRARSR
jgi:hypothetical protein